MSVNDQVLKYINEHGQASPIELINLLKVSQSSIFKSLASLVTSGQLIKTGEGRSTLYKLAPTQLTSNSRVEGTKSQVQAQEGIIDPPPPTNPEPQRDPTFLESFCARFQVNPVMLQKRHDKIAGILSLGFDQYIIYRDKHNFYSTPWGVLCRIILV